ncbi:MULTISPECIES: winged helix-turn-helix domain-containing protein [unclassified Serratia (in: enterobacteria)]|uniref:winged helix-turn-helix domain-containing protein n=1 Tax=unclassified Serratia (in: enterobacteria) TaxID=2647522 RepID=UPI002ED40800
MYIINGKILFDEKRCLIIHLPHKSRKGTIKLNLPVCRCLTLLIESQGEIVSQEKFINDVWRRNGIEVSTNTFYQNIFLLRKNLKIAGVMDDIIITIPKKGLKLSKLVIIKKTDDYDNDLHSQPTKKEITRGEVKSALRISPYIIITAIISFIFIWYFSQQ